MKVISIVLLLASIASVRSISTLKFILSHGVWMTDPTGNTMTHLGLASFELLVNNIFTPFERALSVTDDKGQRVYTVSAAVMGWTMGLIYAVQILSEDRQWAGGGSERDGISSSPSGLGD